MTCTDAWRRFRTRRKHAANAWSRVSRSGYAAQSWTRHLVTWLESPFWAF